MVFSAIIQGSNFSTLSNTVFKVISLPTWNVFKIQKNGECGRFMFEFLCLLTKESLFCKSSNCLRLLKMLTHAALFKKLPLKELKLTYVLKYVFCGTSLPLVLVHPVYILNLFLFLF